MMLLHALANFAKQVEMPLWEFEQKNHSGSVISSFPPFRRIGINIFVLISKQDTRASIGIVRDEFQKNFLVIDSIIRFIITVMVYLCIW